MTRRGVYGGIPAAAREASHLFIWRHVGPSAERSDYDHKARPADGAIVPRCRSCGGPIAKFAR